MLFLPQLCDVVLHLGTVKMVHSVTTSGTVADNCLDLSLC